MRRAAALAAIALAAACGGPSADAPKPNVLLLVMDTTRADRCGFAGGTRGATPRLDAFAKDAVSFTNAWAPCCWTAPSHATLFTGLRPEHHGFTEGVRAFLDPAQTTLAERFRDAGWRTGCFTNNEWIDGKYGTAQGFDRVESLFTKPDRPYPWAAETHRRALDWALAKDAGGKPFFLFVNDMEAHLPYTPPADAASRFLPADATPAETADARAFDHPFSIGYTLGHTPLAPRKIALLSSLYDAEVASVDAEVGNLLDALKSAGVLDRTIVVVCADHGENLGEHRAFGHLHDLHRQVLHVPLLVRFPGAFGGGRVVSDVVRLEDVAPTLLEAAGLAAEKDADGASLARDLEGRVARAVMGPQPWKVAALREQLPGADTSRVTTHYRSAFDGRFHLIRTTPGPDELYDVEADPAEEHDLAPGGGADLERMRKLLAE